MEYVISTHLVCIVIETVRICKKTCFIVVEKINSQKVYINFRGSKRQWPWTVQKYNDNKNFYWKTKLEVWRRLLGSIFEEKEATLVEKLKV